MPVKQMHNISRFALVFLFFCFAGFLRAQELRYSFKNYTPSDGLPSSEVHKVLQDAKHYMWFATDHGVCRYNGYEFKTYNLPDNSILGLFEDYKKRIWAWSFSGQLFIFENGKFYEYKWNTKVVQVIRPGVINALYLDSSEALHISSTGPNSYVITNEGKVKDLMSVENKIQYDALPTTPTRFFTFASSYPSKFNLADLPKLNTTVAVPFGKRKVKITIPYHYRPERFRTRQFSPDKILFFSDQFFIWIYANGSFDLQKPGFRVYEVEQINGLLYLATEKGLLIQNKRGEVIAEYFSGKHITSIEKDYENGLWFTSLLNGVFYLNNTHARHLAKDGEIADRRINVLQNLGDTGVLAGAFDGNILRIERGFFLEEIKTHVKPILSLYKQDNSTFFVGGALNAGVRWFERISQNSLAYVQMSCLTNMFVLDDTLFGGMNDHVFKISLRDTFAGAAISDIPYMPSNKERFRVSKIFATNKKELLIGNHFGLWKYSNRTLQAYDSTKLLLKSRITDISEYQQQLLFLGTRGKGLIVFNTDSLFQLTESEGLISNNIRKIFIDGNILWLATNKGISILTIHSLKPFAYGIRNINVQHGLLSNEVNDITRSGANVVVATNSGITFLDRSFFMNHNSMVVPFFITNILLNGAEIDSAALSNLGFQKRNIAISFEALKYTNPGKVFYRYRLKGYHTNWFYTSDRQVQFNPIPYGTYTLQIQAKTELQNWDEATNLLSLPITCTPPFWTTTWFWITAFSIVMFLVIFLFKKRINDLRARQKQQEELKQKINDTEQMALKAQMNPHFIFNSLNSIQQYVIESDVEGANKFISGFSKLIRQTLEFSSKEFIALDEEVSYLSTYLDLEKARMESAFKYYVNVKTQQPSSLLELPPLLLQPYVENALRHGIRYLKKNEGIISLSFIEQNGFLECIIEDNGIGRKRAMELKAENPIEYQSRGMSLTAERIALLNEGRERKIEAIIEDLKDEEANVAGTRIRVLFPV